MPNRTARSDPRLVGGSVALSWLGVGIHNVADLPGLPFLSPEYAIPTVVSLGLFFAWWRSARRRLAALLLLVWALVMLVVGAIASIIPMDVWPFYPAQTVKHYFFHVVYGLTQLPLIGVAIREVRRSGGRDAAPGVAPGVAGGGAA